MSSQQSSVEHSKCKPTLIMIALFCMPLSCHLIPFISVYFTRLAGTMVDLISQNQPSSLDAFIINFQTWVQFIVRTLPIKLINKGLCLVGVRKMAPPPYSKIFLKTEYNDSSTAFKRTYKRQRM